MRSYSNYEQQCVKYQKGSKKCIHTAAAVDLPRKTRSTVSQCLLPQQPHLDTKGIPHCCIFFSTGYLIIPKLPYGYLCSKVRVSLINEERKLDILQQHNVEDPFNNDKFWLLHMNVDATQFQNSVSKMIILPVWDEPRHVPFIQNVLSVSIIYNLQNV